MSANLPAWMWRDPADVAERVGAASCQGCGWVIRLRRRVIERSDEVIEDCFKGRVWGRKCKLYLETEGHADRDAV